MVQEHLLVISPSYYNYQKCKTKPFGTLKQVLNNFSAYVRSLLESGLIFSHFMTKWGDITLYLIDK